MLRPQHRPCTEPVFPLPRPTTGRGPCRAGQTRHCICGRGTACSCYCHLQSCGGPGCLEEVRAPCSLLSPPVTAQPCPSLAGYPCLMSFSCRGALLEARAGVYELSQPDDNQYCLRICRVSRRDVGSLTCTARNRHGTQACSVTLELAGG